MNCGCNSYFLAVAHAGSIASLWQQAGRAGRREQASVSIYVGFDGPLDQFFMHQPANLFARPIETAQARPWTSVSHLDWISSRRLTASCSVASQLTMLFWPSMLAAR